MIKSERRITNRKIVIEAVRKVMIDKYDKSEVIKKFCILFYLLLLIIKFYLPVSNVFFTFKVFFSTYFDMSKKLALLIMD